MKNPLKGMTESELNNLSVPLRALWYASHDQWETAHQLVQDDPSRESAWVHAYLHRVEGDLGNARYWYHRAGKTPATSLSLDQELDQLIAEIGDV